MLPSMERNVEGFATYLSMTTAGVWEAMLERTAAQYRPGNLGMLCEQLYRRLPSESMRLLSLVIVAQPG
jgi:hypothetical protein